MAARAGVARRRLAAVVALAAVALLASSAAAASMPLAITPGDINTCTNSNATLVPHITSSKTCSSVSLISTSAKGFAVAFSSGRSNALVAAAGACGDAVATGVGSICKGADPGLEIIAASQICANALAALYSRTAAGALVLPKSLGAAQLKDLFLDVTSLASQAPNKTGYWQACASGCTNAQSAAEALAQGAACGATSATNGCIAVHAEVRGETFSRAFTTVAADGWSKACAKGAGAALTSSENLAASAAASFATAVARVAAKACAQCPGCKCSPILSLFGLNAAGRWADTFSGFASGKIGVARALSGASSALCAANGSVVTTKALTTGAMAAVADMVGAAFAETKTSALQVGGGSSCSKSSVSTKLEALKQATTQVMSDVGATVWGGWCPKAAAKLYNVSVLTGDTIARVANKSSVSCGNWPPSGLSALLPAGLPKKATQREVITAALTSSGSPLKQKVSEALEEARKCGCPPSLCLFCKGAEQFPFSEVPAAAAKDTTVDAPPADAADVEA